MLAAMVATVWSLPAVAGDPAAPRQGTPMGPWEFEISEDEAFWLVRQLRSGKGAK
jgi:hypothetical protein